MVMKDENTDENIRTNVIIALQQVSVRTAAQLVMIENDLIKWLVSKMKVER